MVITMASYALQTPPRVAHAKPPGPIIATLVAVLHCRNGADHCFPSQTCLEDNFSFLTVCWMSPINFPPFHQVRVAGGMDPKVEHLMLYARSLDSGHCSVVIVTKEGPTTR